MSTDNNTIVSTLTSCIRRLRDASAAFAFPGHYNTLLQKLVDDPHTNKDILQAMKEDGVHLITGDDTNASPFTLKDAENFQNTLESVLRALDNNDEVETEVETGAEEEEEVETDVEEEA